MKREESIKQQLIEKFGYLEGKINIQRSRRLYADVSLANFEEVFVYASKQMNFSHLLTITGLDEQDNIGIIYHLAQKEILLNIKISVPKNNPNLKSIIGYFPGAEIYERELVDLLGVKVEGLPEGYRYPLTDEWPKDQFPLRKDWKPDSQKAGC